MKLNWLVGLGLILLAVGSSASVAQQMRDPQPELYDASRLSQYSNIELMDFLSAPSFEKNIHGRGLYSTLPPDRDLQPAPSGFGGDKVFTIQADDHALDFAAAIEQELIRRHPLAEIVRTFDRTSDRAQRAWMMDIMTRLRGSEVDDALRSSVTEEQGDANYLALKYFAGRCDPSALRILNKNYFGYGVSSPEWASVVREFGKCRYKPAAKNLADTIFAADIDLEYAALESLKMIYPEARITTDDPMVMQQKWKDYATTHGS